jgi:hypothetical protein
MATYEGMDVKFHALLMSLYRLMSGKLHASAALLLRQYFLIVDPSALVKPITEITASVIQAVATLIMY